jgi:hypothetical protein
MQRVLYIKFCKDITSPIDIVYKQCFTTCFYWRKKKIAFVWFQKLVLVDCLKWEQSRCSVFIHERSSYDIRSSTNRATMTLGFRCFAQRQRRRQKRGEGERARARNGMLLFSPLKSNSSAVLVLLSLCSRHSGNELLSLQARERSALFLICFISFHLI